MSLVRTFASTIVSIMMIATIFSVVQNASGGLPSGWNGSTIATHFELPNTSNWNWYYLDGATDSNGATHVIYRGIDYSKRDAVLELFYTDNSAGTWATPVLINSTEGDFRDVSIAVDSSCHTHIVYLSDNGATNQFAVIYETNARGSWVSDTVSSHSLSYYSYDLSRIIVDDSDVVHVLYFDGSLPGIVHAELSGDKWMKKAIITSPIIDFMTAVVDSMGNVDIAYVNGTTDTSSVGDLVLTTDAGGIWSTTVIDKAIALSIDLALDGNNKAHLVYLSYSQNGSSYIPKLEYATNAGGQWVTEIVSEHAAAQYTMGLQIVVNSTGYPIICQSGFTYTGNAWEYPDHITSAWTDVASRSDGTWNPEATNITDHYVMSMTIGPNDDLNLVGIEFSSYEHGGERTLMNARTNVAFITDMVPGPVTNLDKKIGNGMVTLGWDAPTSGGAATEISIYRSTTDSRPGTPIATFTAANERYVDTNVTNGVDYYYWIIPANANGTGTEVGTGKITPSTSSGGGNAMMIAIVGLVAVLAIVALAFVLLKKRKK